VDEDKLQDYRFQVRKLQYEHHQADVRAAFQLQGDYGKWLVASLLLIHGGAFLFLTRSPDLAKSVLPVVYWWLIGGLMLALVCGFVAWINWDLHTVLYKPLNAGMIVNDDQWPQLDARMNWWIGATHKISIGAGLASGFCILGAATAAYLTLG
jgi:hypothetical protein